MLAADAAAAGYQPLPVHAAALGLHGAIPKGKATTAARQLAADVCWAAPLSVTAILDIERRTAQMDPIEAMSVIPDLPSYRAAIDSDDGRSGASSSTRACSGLATVFRP